MGIGEEQIAGGNANGNGNANATDPAQMKRNFAAMSAEERATFIAEMQKMGEENPTETPSVIDVEREDIIARLNAMEAETAAMRRNLGAGTSSAQVSTPNNNLWKSSLTCWRKR